jgi:small subunit ribosomal protein S14
MASIGSIEREKKLARGVNLHKKARAELKKKVKDSTLSNLERLNAQKQLEYKKAFRLQVRMRRRCGVTGDPRGFNGRYGLSRNELRKLISYNLIPGVKKASW